MSKTKRFPILAVAAVSAFLLVSCGKPAETPVSDTASGTVSSGAVSENSGSESQVDANIKIPDAPKQTPAEETAAEAFSDHDVKKCATLANGSGACADAYWNMEGTYGMNPRACAMISDGEKAASCETQSNAYVEAYATLPGQCRKISEGVSRQRCMDKTSLTIARSAGIEACDALRTEDLKRSCMDDHFYQMAASGTGGALVCRKISNASVRTSCEQVRQTPPTGK